MRHKQQGHVLGLSCGGMLLALLCAGCLFSRTLPPPPPPPPPPPAFPPQKVMQDGNFAEFLAENERVVEHCRGKPGCDVTLFNLGFVHAYVQSPYYNPTAALPYFDELVNSYPQSPWAFLGRSWVALIRENLALSETQVQLQTNLNQKEKAISTLRTQLNRSRELETRSREVDLEMEMKERQLLR